MKHCANQLTERLEQELQCVALVPLDHGADLQHLAPLGQPQLRVVLEHGPDQVGQRAPFLNGNKKKLVSSSIPLLSRAGSTR
jgi:hypothetical protein